MGIILLISVILFGFIIVVTFYQRYKSTPELEENNGNEKVIHLTDESFNETIKEGITLVDFWAPWCGPCRRQDPIINKLALEFDEKVKVCKLNVDDHKKAALQMKIKNIPNIIIFENGDPKMQLIGLKPLHQIRNALLKIIEK